MFLLFCSSFPLKNYVVIIKMNERNDRTLISKRNVHKNSILTLDDQRFSCCLTRL